MNEEETLLRRAREDARRIVQRLHNFSSHAGASAASESAAVSVSTASLAGRIVRQAETQAMAGALAGPAGGESEICRLRLRVAELEKQLAASRRPATARPLASAAKEMGRLGEGVWGQKLSFKRNAFLSGLAAAVGGNSGGRKLQERFIFVQSGRLWWNEIGDNQEMIGKSSVRLDEVLRIEYGSVYVAELFRTEESWKCVSIFTRERSFDWKLDEDEDAAALMVVLGRLCVQAVGGARSRSEFIWKRALCKIENKCRRDKISKTQLLVQAVKRAHLTAS